VSNSASPVDAILLPSNPLFVPLAQVSEDVRDTVWDRILRLALEVDSYKDGYMHEEFSLSFEQLYRTRTFIPQVSRAFKVIPFAICSVFALIQYTRDSHIRTFMAILSS
jgi:hypothetical protein